MKKRNAVLTLLIIMFLAFIWGNSVLPPAESDGLSYGLVDVLSDLLPDSLTDEEANHVVRKLAHFTEYLLLGVLFCLRFSSLPDRFLIPFSFAFSCAVTDETIQIFTSRGPSFTDVAIDSAGAALGVSLILLLTRKKRA